MELLAEYMGLHVLVSFAVAGFVVAISAVVVWWYWPLRGRLKRVPPGWRGLPLLGESLDYYLAMSSPDPQAFAAKRKARYGKLFRSNMFGHDAVVCLDPEVSKFVLQNEGSLFQSCYPPSMRALIGDYSPLNLHGAMHKRVSGEAVRLMTPDRLRASYMELIERDTQRTLDSWKNGTVYVEEETKRFTLSLMAKQLFSLKPGSDIDNLVESFFHLVKGLISFPLNIPGTTYNKALRARKQIVETITLLINERSSQPEVIYDDFLAQLMACEDNPLEKDEIIDFMLFLVLAGYETTATVIAFAIKFLAETPKALEKLREEHDALTRSQGNGGRLTWEDYKSMTFTQCVIFETLRITAVPPTLYRKVVQDVEINGYGYTIPKGWIMAIHLLGMRLDPDLYPDPMTFNPWRWNQQGNNLKNAAWMFPFGGGPRYCPGSELAKLEASIFLHHLVTKYNWELQGDETISWFPLPFLSNHLPAKFRERQK